MYGPNLLFHSCRQAASQQQFVDVACDVKDEAELSDRVQVLKVSEREFEMHLMMRKITIPIREGLLSKQEHHNL